MVQLRRMREDMYPGASQQQESSALLIGQVCLHGLEVLSQDPPQYHIQKAFRRLRNVIPGESDAFKTDHGIDR